MVATKLPVDPYLPVAAMEQADRKSQVPVTWEPAYGVNGRQSWLGMFSDRVRRPVSVKWVPPGRPSPGEHWQTPLLLFAS